MSNDNYDDLIQLASRATQGPWRYWDEVGKEIFPANGGFRVLLANNAEERNLRYIAAASPSVIQALVKELREARAELAAIKQRRPAVEIRQVNDGFGLYEAERLVRGGFEREHKARLWAADQGLEVRP